MNEVEVSAVEVPQNIGTTPLQNSAESEKSNIVDVEASVDNIVELGTSPTQERSSNSHQHDSEYDTASDLEVADEYDDDDDDDNESGTDEEYDESEEHLEGDEGISLQKLDADAPKKVDEDRRNPQYIPKRGTFYEHDDRMADNAENVDINASSSSADAVEKVSGLKISQTTISQASKTMKKWQAATDRWSHDRFDAGEQAPKSRSELVSTYGYDIRNEDAPPRARRRRRYARGPSKYQRNWEDENAYLKISNKERRPPRPSDFPALNERVVKNSKPKEKENKRAEQSNRAIEKAQGNTQRDNFADGKMSTADKNNKYAHTASASRQVPMEFKSKQRRNHAEQQYQHQSQSLKGERSQSHINNFFEQKANTSLYAKQTQNFNNDNYNNIQQENYHNNAKSLQYNSVHKQQQQANQQPQPMPMRQQYQVVKIGSTQTSTLSLRLQQNRNEIPKAQIECLEQTNHFQQVNQQQAANLFVNKQQAKLAQDQQERVQTKRYSCIRRSQHDAQTQQHQQQQLTVEQQHHHQQQQLQQLQHLQQQPPQQTAILLPAEQQHILAQANLMQQLYHQENLQAQMQALQVSQATPAHAKTSAFATATQPPPPTITVPPSAYYVTAGPPDAAFASQAAPSSNYLASPNGTSTVAPAANTTATQATSAVNKNYPNYQNYNTVGGTTYFVPPNQPSVRPVVLPQRRPTNAIPILPPTTTEQKQDYQRCASEAKEDTTGTNQLSSSPSTAPIGSAENIDHIIDNMFVQRPAFQPLRKSVSPPIVIDIQVEPTNDADRKLCVESNALIEDTETKNPLASERFFEETKNIVDQIVTTEQA